MPINPTDPNAPLQSSSGLDIKTELADNFDGLMKNAENVLSGDSLFFLQLQQAIARESQAYQAISNVMNSRDQAKSRAINNIGS